MKKVEDFTDQELAQQIATLKEMDVMGSKKLLDSFIAERNRREEERKKKEEDKKAVLEKQRKEMEKDAISYFIGYYNKCYRLEDKCCIKYIHVEGVVNGKVVIEFLFNTKNGYTNYVYEEKRLNFDEFKELIKNATEIDYDVYVERNEENLSHLTASWWSPFIW